MNLSLFMLNRSGKVLEKGEKTLFFDFFYKAPPPQAPKGVDCIGASQWCGLTHPVRPRMACSQPSAHGVMEFITVDQHPYRIRDGKVDNVPLGARRTSIRMKSENRQIVEGVRDFEARVRKEVADSKVRVHRANTGTPVRTN